MRRLNFAISAPASLFALGMKDLICWLMSPSRSWSSRIVAFAVAWATANGLTSSAQAEAERTIAGPAEVVDGDTIKINGIRIRLRDIDAPERGSVCEGRNVYQAAQEALSDFVGDQLVRCAIEGEDHYQRLVASCSVSLASVEEFVVSSGWGRDWPKFSKGKFAAQEMDARTARRGIWGLACPDDMWGGRDYE